MCARVCVCVCVCVRVRVRVCVLRGTWRARQGAHRLARLIVTQLPRHLPQKGGLAGGEVDAETVPAQRFFCMVVAWQATQCMQRVAG
jgi:hypothetical protein